MGGGNSKPKDLKELVKLTHLSEKQIKHWYQDFCKVKANTSSLALIYFHSAIYCSEMSRFSDNDRNVPLPMSV